ncbi:MAG: T9SS type A sorting domain-containing protein, partial [Candidatus Fermentibacterota bacterium]
AHEGGGIYATGSSALIEDCEIWDNNTTGGPGGGVFLHASGDAGPYRLIGCDIHDNEGSGGAGIRVSASHAKILGNRIDSNIGGGGGGILMGCDSALVCGNAITGNNGGGHGGGIYIDEGTVTLIGNVIAENYATSVGGGVYERSSETIYMLNNSIINNATDPDDSWGGGLRSWKDSIFIENSIFWGNSATTGPQITLPGTLDTTYAWIEYCNIQGGQDSIYHSDSLTYLSWGPGNTDVDPEFEAGPLSDYHLAWGSPCIDAGNPSPEHYDPEDPLNPGYALWPAMGTLLNDMGAYGGGGVGYWLAVEDPGGPSPPSPGPELRVFPNPFTSSCAVCFELSETGHVTVDVYDLSGRLVERIFDREAGPGDQAVWLDATGLPAGVYVVRIVAQEAANTERCVLLR